MKKRILTVVGIVAAFLVISYAFVPQVLGGKIVNQSDISGWQGMSHEMMSWNSGHPDDQTAWTESMFGGMPTATIHASTKGDWTQAIYDLLLTGKRPATYFFISLLGAWLMMLAFGISPLLAVGGAIAVTFCSYNVQIIQVGHNTKMQAIAFLPWVLAALAFTYRQALAESGGRRWLAGTALGSALFGICLSFQVKANHPQITYYLALMILIYAAVLLVWMLMSKERRSALKRFFAASALLLVLGCTGIATNAIKLLPTAEYTPYSMRGGSTSAQKDFPGKNGLDLDYATAWSYGWEELPNLMIPNFNGGSSAGAVNPKRSETYSLLKSAGQSNLREVCRNLPLYWGSQPFTAGPMYMGSICVFLFVLGLFLYKGKEKWWIVIATVLAVFLALGDHFMWFTKLFYDFVPLYNKFRTVSMALVILQFTLPLLGFLMLENILNGPAGFEEFKKPCLVSSALTAGFCFLVWLIPTIAGTFTGSVDQGRQEILVDALVADRITLLRSDALRSMLFICLASGLLLWGMSAKGEKSRSRRRTVSILVCVLVFADLFTIGKRYLGQEDFVTPQSFQRQFDKRPVDEIILEDKDLSYRVLDLTVDVFNDSHPSYWHKNIGGYSPAKLQRYQEFIDSTLSGEIEAIIRSVSEATTIREAEEALPYLKGLAEMNCRYIIVGGEIPPLTYKYAKGNAWFDGDSGSSVFMTSYAPNELKYSYLSEGGGTVVFSEVYYPAGWQLTMEDGTELQIDLYDGILRSAKVPAGSHQLVMRFEPASYRIGETVSRASSIALILAVILCMSGVTAIGRKNGSKS